MPSKTSTFLAATLFAAAAATTEGKFLYEEQGAWPDVASTPENTNACDGDMQSPVNLNTGDYVCMKGATPYSLYSGDCTLGDYEFTINDHGVKASVEKASCEKPKMIIPGTGKVYEVLQFHIHTGCENTFNGTGCDADLHMVHIAKDDVALPAATSNVALPDLAVLGLMMYGADEYSEEMQPLVDSWLDVSCSNGNCAVGVSDAAKSQPFSPYDLVPDATAIYNFQGSLTTPPCWEVVNWNVIEKPLMMSFRQILAISNLINKYNGYKKSSDDTCTADYTVADQAGLTARMVQPLNGRQVVKNCAPVQMMSSFPSSTVEDMNDDKKEQDPSSQSTSSAASTSLSVVAAALSFLAVAALF